MAFFGVITLHPFSSLSFLFTASPTYQTMQQPVCSFSGLATFVPCMHACVHPARQAGRIMVWLTPTFLRSLVCPSPTPSIASIPPQVVCTGTKILEKNSNNSGCECTYRIAQVAFAFAEHRCLRCRGVPSCVPAQVTRRTAVVSGCRSAGGH